MNDTQWVFELEAMNQESVERYEDLLTMSKWVKGMIIDLLGIGLIPMEDADTGLLRMPGPNEYTPLALMLAREDIIKLLDERMESFVIQENARRDLAQEGYDPTRIVGGPAGGQAAFTELSPEELEAFMKDDGDIAFENAPEDLNKGLNWGSSFDRAVMDTLVLNKDDISSDDPTVPSNRARTLGQTRRDFIKQQLSRMKPDQGAVSYETVELCTSHDESSDDEPVSSTKVSVTLTEV